MSRLLTRAGGSDFRGVAVNALSKRTLTGYRTRFTIRRTGDAVIAGTVLESDGALTGSTLSNRCTAFTVGSACRTRSTAEHIARITSSGCALRGNGARSAVGSALDASLVGERVPGSAHRTVRGSVTIRATSRASCRSDD